MQAISPCGDFRGRRVADHPLDRFQELAVLGKASRLARLDAQPGRAQVGSRSTLNRARADCSCGPTAVP
jgi:hypothetical protein